MVLMLTIVTCFPPAAKSVPIEILNNGDTGSITGSPGGTALLEGASLLSGIGSAISFLDLNQTGGSGPEKGYNTTGSTEFQTTDAEAVPLSSLGIIDILGTSYYEFGLSNNQTGSDTTLSIEEIQLFQDVSSGLSGYDTSTRTLPGATLVFDWAAPANGHIVVEDINGGESKVDLLLFVPAASFTTEDFVYLYAGMGGSNPGNNGPERWVYFAGENGVPGDPGDPGGGGGQSIPEPGTIVLLGSGLLGLSIFGRRRGIR